MIIASAIIVAAGSSKRMGGKTNKPYIELNGKPMLAYSLEVFAQVPDIKEVLVAKVNAVAAVLDAQLKQA